MKKQLAGLSVLLLAATASAVENPTIIPDVVVYGISPDNKHAVGEVGYTVFFFDLDDWQNPKIFSESEDGTVGYSVGMGNFISNSSALITRTGQGASAWCWNTDGSITAGRWRSMNLTASSTGLGSPNGVTADGSRACGSMSTGSAFGEENHTYVTPCFWDFDGTSFTRTELEHPQTDYAGLAPQYITALCISDDGATIIGQIVSNNGFLCEYVVYRRGADGTWSYVKPFDDLVNPDKLQYPEFPGESPSVPTPESYFNDAEKAAYEKALEEYQNGDAEEPDAKDFLTDPAGIEAYNAACDTYNDWVKKYEAWQEVDQKVLMQSISFLFNSGAISPNGKFFCATASKTYMDTQTGELFDIYEPVLYDLTKMERIDVPTDLSIAVTAVSNEGDVVGYVRDADIDFGYFLAAGAKEWQPLEEYVVERNPSMAQWVEENWKHSIEVIIDEEEGISEYRDMYITGIPFMSRDFTVLSTAAYAFWTDGPEDLYNRYHSNVIYLDVEASSIAEVESAADSTDNAWYNLQGRRIEHPTAPGIYIHGGKKTLVK